MADALGWIGAVGGTVGAVTGLAGIYFGQIGKKTGEKAQRTAETANETAAEAVRIAREANRIAVEANDLASDANTISKDALAVASDQLDYAWVLKVEDDGSAIVINDCAHIAVGATVVVDVNGEVQATRCGENVAAFKQLSLDATRAFEKHIEEVRAHPYRNSISSPGVFITGSAGDIITTTFRATITWSTESGVERSCVVKNDVRHRMEYGGTPVRLKPERQATRH
ncbi:hypothetical protein JVX90_13895 [Gordonia sp. PDNC005]|uniref:hypothetical protein n=1 Tax=Gordonia sp. PDNC005 TaxID=2811424 RepID=UPI0019656CC4|nr:hypothetical protein [Gordonia sp. PDNC005]QRY61505.1 hypothetical protein JVX90_13895 [Gordonia sp. PDNC005]